MTNIASKNLYDLLGNDPELDPDREPEPPTKAVDKPVGRTGKRNAAPEAPAASSGSRSTGGRSGGGFTGSEQAYRDRNTGANQNRGKPTEDGFRQDRHPDRLRGSDDFRGRGGRGRGGPRRGGDRHSRTGVGEHAKQAAHGWGGEKGTEEWADEKAGEAIAADEEKAGFDTSVPPPVNAEGEAWKPDTSGASAADEPAAESAPAPAPEPEEVTKSYDEYLAEQAEKKLKIEQTSIRKPNEGSKQFPEGKAIDRAGEEESFIAGTGGKKARTREPRKEKTLLELDGQKMRPQEPAERGFGGRGGRGGRGRGEGGFRGERGRGGEGGFRGERGEGRGRGGGERGRGRGDRERGERGGGGFRGERGERGDRGGGSSRGGRGGAAPVNVKDESAFPSLGS